jgi:hypothetical protein
MCPPKLRIVFTPEEKAERIAHSQHEIAHLVDRLMACVPSEVRSLNWQIFEEKAWLEDFAGRVQ